MDPLLKDVIFGCRELCKNSAFTAVAVVVLALGIGLNTAIFGVEPALPRREAGLQRQDQPLVRAPRPHRSAKTNQYPLMSAKRSGENAATWARFLERSGPLFSATRRHPKASGRTTRNISLPWSFLDQILRIPGRASRVPAGGARRMLQNRRNRALQARARVKRGAASPCLPAPFGHCAKPRWVQNPNPPAILISWADPGLLP